MGIDLGEDAARVLMAKRSRGTPRICLRLLRRVRDFAQVRGDGTITAEVAAEALRLEGVDNLGLDTLDRAYLRVLADTYEGGPAGLEAIAATLGEDSGTLEDVVEAVFATDWPPSPNEAGAATHDCWSDPYRGPST